MKREESVTSKLSSKINTKRKNTSSDLEVKYREANWQGISDEEIRKAQEIARIDEFSSKIIQKTSQDLERELQEAKEKHDSKIAGNNAAIEFYLSNKEDKGKKEITRLINNNMALSTNYSNYKASQLQKIEEAKRRELEAFAIKEDLRREGERIQFAKKRTSILRNQNEQILANKIAMQKEKELAMQKEKESEEQKRKKIIQDRKIKTEQNNIDFINKKEEFNKLDENIKNQKKAIELMHYYKGVGNSEEIERKIQTRKDRLFEKIEEVALIKKELQSLSKSKSILQVNILKEPTSIKTGIIKSNINTKADSLLQQRRHNSEIRHDRSKVGSIKRQATEDGYISVEIPGSEIATLPQDLKEKISRRESQVREFLDKSNSKESIKSNKDKLTFGEVTFGKIELPRQATGSSKIHINNINTTRSYLKKQ